MLLSRLSLGISSAGVSKEVRTKLLQDSLISEESENIVLTVKGRLLADVVFRQLSP